MKDSLKIAALAVLILTFCLVLPGCKQQSQTADALDEIEAANKPQPEPPEPAPKPAPPKVTEETYIEITARTALIWEKYKDDAPSAEKTVEALYEKLGITHEDYKAYQAKLTPQIATDLQKKVQEFMQKILGEYR
jgi:hypothetical protein